MAKRGLPEENPDDVTLPAPDAAPQAAGGDQPAGNGSADGTYNSGDDPFAQAPFPLSDATAPAAAAPAARVSAGDETAAGETATGETPADESAADEAESGDALSELTDGAGDGDATAPKKRKRRLSDILLLVLALLLLIGGAIFGIMAWQKSHGEETFPDMAGNRVVPEDDSAQDPAFQAAADANPDVGTRFIISSVGLDVPLGEVNEVNGVMNPPGFTSAYRVRNRGVNLPNASAGTVYVIAHSLRSPGQAPGNFVIDVTAGAVAVPVGATIQVGDRTYQLTSSKIIPKTELGAQTELWANTPGMLVFITCLQYPDRSHDLLDNVVLIGQLVS